MIFLSTLKAVHRGHVDAVSAWPVERSIAAVVVDAGRIGHIGDYGRGRCDWLQGGGLDWLKVKPVALLDVENLVDAKKWNCLGGFHSAVVGINFQLLPERNQAAVFALADVATKLTDCL